MKKTWDFHKTGVFVISGLLETMHFSIDVSQEEEEEEKREGEAFA